MIFGAPLQCGQCSMSISNTRFRRREHTIETNKVEPWLRNPRAASRCMNSSVDRTIYVVPHPDKAFLVSTPSPHSRGQALPKTSFSAKHLLANCRSRDVTTQVFQLFALIHGATHPCMRAKAMYINAVFFAWLWHILCGRNWHNAGVRTHALKCHIQERPLATLFTAVIGYLSGIMVA